MFHQHGLVSPESLSAPADLLYEYGDPQVVSRILRMIRMGRPLGVITVYTRPDDSKEVLTGESYRLAAIRAGLPELAVHLYTGEITPADLLLVRLQDKETRSRMNAVSLGQRYIFILEAKRWLAKVLSSKLGINDCLVTKPISIATNLCTQLQRLYIAGDLAMEEAYYLSRLSNHTHQLELAARLKSLDRATWREAVNKVLKPPDAFPIIVNRWRDNKRVNSRTTIA